MEMRQKMRILLKALVLLIYAMPSLAGPLFVGDFESGEVNKNGSSIDGFFIQALKGTSTYVPVGMGGAGPSSGLDTRVVPYESIGGETVKPRAGKYFMRTEIFYSKDYTSIDGNGGTNKPRQTIALQHDNFLINYDEEAFVGFSIYTPKNYATETGISGDRGQVMLLTCYSTTKSTFFSISQYAPSNDNVAHWWLNYYKGDSSVYEANAQIYTIDLGRVAPDIGKWTDFVIRYKANPFSQTTNPAATGIPNSVNKTYYGNKGILQVWKSEGIVKSDGNREMSLKLNKVNTPVGLVPQSDQKLLLSFRAYKYGWHNNPTSIKSSIWYGFDEIKFGRAIADSADYSSVAPGDQEQSNAPLPPSSVSIN